MGEPYDLNGVAGKGKIAAEATIDAYDLDRLVLELAQAILADHFALVGDDILDILAEYASWVVLFQDNLVAFHKDFERVLDGDIHRPSQLEGNHAATQFSHLADDPGRLHEYFLPLQNKTR